MILLDTDSVTLLTRGHPRLSERVLSSRDLIAIAVVTRIEILRGRFEYLLKASDGTQLQRAQQMLAQSEQDLAKLIVIPIDVAAASVFDQLRQNKKLRKIGRADLLIASIALAHGTTLVTRNLRHFQQVPGLRLENWAD